VVSYIDMAENSRKSLWYLEVSVGTPEMHHSSSWYPWGILVVKRHKDSLWYIVVSLTYGSLCVMWPYPTHESMILTNFNLHSMHCVRKLLCEFEIFF
jgi:hypothetical protein